MGTALITLNYNDKVGCESVCNRALECREIERVIIVDNNSPDRSYEELKKLENDRVTVIQTGKNGGYSFGYNYGFKAAQKYGADKVILCNSDVIFNREMILACLNFLDQNPEAGAVSVRQKDINLREAKSAWTYPKYWDEIKFCFYCFRKFVLPRHRRDAYPVEGDRQEVDVLAGCFTVYKMAALLECGMYDENVFLYNEENIISRRLHAVGYRLYRLNNYFYIHAHHRTPSKPSTNFNSLLHTAIGSYYYQVNYEKIGKVKQILFKICIYCGTVETLCLNYFRRGLDLIKEK